MGDTNNQPVSRKRMRGAWLGVLLGLGGCAADAGGPLASDEAVRFSESASEESAPLEAVDTRALVARVRVSELEVIDLIDVAAPGEAPEIAVGVAHRPGAPTLAQALLDGGATPLELFMAIAPSEAPPTVLVDDHARLASAGLAEIEPVVRPLPTRAVTLAGPDLAIYACHIWRGDFQAHADANGMTYAHETWLNEAFIGNVGTMDRVHLGACNEDVSDSAVRVRIQRNTGSGWTDLAGYTVQLDPSWAYDYYNTQLCNGSTQRRIRVDQVAPDTSSTTGDYYHLAGSWREQCILVEVAGS